MLSLSTSWNAIKHKEGQSLIVEIRELGFESVEINYQVTAEQLSQVSQMQKKGEIEVSSLHNIVPLPEGADPNTAHRLYPFTSPNSEVRKKAVNLTKQTIDQAVELGAGAIVLHLGESWEAPLVEVEKSYVNAKLKSHQSRERVEEIRQKLIQLPQACSEEGVERIVDC